MSISFDLGEFQKAFDIAVGQQRQERAATDFEFNGKIIPIKRQTKLSDAMIEYLDTFSSDGRFTGSEKFDEKSPNALVDFLEKHPSIDISTVAFAVHAAKLLQQATRNGRPLNDVWKNSKVSANLTAIYVLSNTWSQGEDLERLIENERQLDRAGITYG